VSPALTSTIWAVFSGVAAAVTLLGAFLYTRERSAKERTDRRMRWLSDQPEPARASLLSFRTQVVSWRNSHTAAALRLRMGEYWLMVAGVTALGFLVGLLLRGLVGGILLGVGGFGGTLYYFRWRRDQWLHKAESQLPDFLRGISTAMRAGSSFAQALTLVGQDFPDPLGREIKRLSRREALGLTLEDALTELSERVPSKDLQLVIVAIQTQREVGGALSPLLESVVETIGQRQALKNEIRTLTAQGRASGMILTLLPIGLGTLIWFINPTYMGPVFTTGTGHFMLGYGIASLGVGSLVIRRMVRGPEL
jgi:tight adherence protein B